MGSASWDGTPAEAPGRPPGSPGQPGQPGHQIPRQGAYGQQTRGQEEHEGGLAGFARGLAHSPFGGFIPWILYWVIGGPATWETAAIAALLAAGLLTVLSIEREAGARAAAG